MTASNRTFPLRAPAVLAAALLAVAGLPAYGQAPDEQPTVSVSEATGEGELIRVPVNKSVLLDFSHPVKDIRLAKPEFAEVTATSPKQVLLTGKAFGTTKMIVRFNEGADVSRVFDIAVDIELDRMLASIRSAVPRAKVKAYALLDSVVLTGNVPDAIAAERVIEIANVFSPRVINQLQVAGVQQVLLRVTVAEVNRSVSKQLGVNGWLAGDDFRDMFFLNNLDGLNPANIGAAGGASVRSDIPFFTGADGIPVTDRTTISFGFPRVQMQVFVQALRENGLLRILAEPNLVTLSGQEASFLAGGEIPIPLATDERIKIEYKEFGVRLNFTPAVLNENLIRLEVTPELSEPDPSNSVTVGGLSVPGFASRRVHTTVEMGAGQTIAIGGLLNDRVRAIVRRVPGLGDLPILGVLFSSKEFLRDQTELVVLVTPELISPVTDDQVTYVPGANWTPPNDFELYLEGKLEGDDGHRMPALSPRVNHNWPVRTDELYGTSLKLRGPLGPAGLDEGK